MLKRPLAILAVLTAASFLVGCSGDTSETARDASPTGPACAYQTDGRPASKKVDLPPDQAAVSGDVAVSMKTSAGDLEATLDADTTPCTVNSFVSLADQGYFDGTECHRLTTQGIFVLQCGDPTATGSGGPGYSFKDELSGEETYGPGTLAMANAGPDTNGSQFFIVYGDSPLPPSYTVFGQMDDASLDVVKAIADKGTDGGGPDGAPQEKVEIDSVTAE